MFGFNKKDEEPIISFVTNNGGLLSNKENMPIDASKLPPSWWKSIPAKPKFDNGETALTVKMCPSFTDYFGQGFIVPAWMDSKLSYDVEKDYWHAEARDASDRSWGIHGNSQFLDYVDFEYNKLKPTMIFKLETPWKIITKPGWSVLQVPLFYHFDNDLIALPGIIDTDIEHDLNIQFLYFGDKKQIDIRRGQPLVQYIPFKREEMSYDVRESNDSDKKKFKAVHHWIFDKFPGTGAYRSMQRQRDKNGPLF
jgi:hypothetical protein